MKVRNVSRRIIKLLNGKDKVTLIPGTQETYDVTKSADVEWYIQQGELIEVGSTDSEPKRGRKPAAADSDATKTDETKADEAK